MSRRMLKFSRARQVALALGVGAISSLAMASAASATAPAFGNACQSSDGKISGRGSTFQNNALSKALISGYTSDVCGTVGNAGNLNAGYGGVDPAGSGMLAYNYSEGTTAVKNGSGAGLNAMTCRTDAFGGTDLPYSNPQLAGSPYGSGGLSFGGPGAELTGTQTCANIYNVTNAPYQPQPTFPPAGSGTQPLMVFPIAAGAVAVAVNFNGVCTTKPTSLNITSNEFDLIMQGKIDTWNDPALVATDPQLSTDGCSGQIQRIVRGDNSGTTAITKTDLNGIDANTLCDGTVGGFAQDTFGAWGTLAAPAGGAANTAWPTTAGQPTACGNGTIAAGAVYSATASPGTGSGILITLLDSNSTPAGDAARTAANAPCPGGGLACGGEGGIGYAELGLWPNPLPSGVVFAHLESKSATVANGLLNNTPPAASFITPGTPGNASQCIKSLNSAVLPGGQTFPEAVGLGGDDDDWANDSGADVNPQVPSNQYENIAYAGSGYPNCGLTFDTVFTNMSDQVSGAVTPSGSPIPGMTNDQVRTLYSFFTYVFSPLGQSYLAPQTYDQLPAAWLPTLRTGFQQNF